MLILHLLFVNTLGLVLFLYLPTSRLFLLSGRMGIVCLLKSVLSSCLLPERAVLCCLCLFWRRLASGRIGVLLWASRLQQVSGSDVDNLVDDNLGLVGDKLRMIGDKHGLIVDNEWSITKREQLLICLQRNFNGSLSHHDYLLLTNVAKQGIIGLI